MNEDAEEKEDLVETEELLAPLREASPTAAMRAANRRAVFDAPPAAPWWRRSVAVPAPVAIASVVAMLLMSLSLALPGREASPAIEEPFGTRVVEETEGITPEGPGYARSETHQYYPGVGVVNRLVIYQPEDPR